MASRGAAVQPWPIAPAQHPSTAQPIRPILLLILAVGAVGYNAVLAWATARNLPIGEAQVIAAEFLLLLAALALIVVTGRQKEDGPAFLLLAFFTAGAVLISMASQMLFPDMVRNAAIIALFFMLGCRAGPEALRLCFGAASVLVAAGLALEIASTPAYVSFFQPGLYYELTRGAAPLETVDGLYRNASGFEGRFFIAEILDHRASSIFLEPVSLGNFGVVLLGFVTCFWSRLNRFEKVAHLAVALLILVASNSRILLGFMLICPLVYFVGGWFDRGKRLLILPLILTTAALIYATGPDVQSDDLVGRVGKAARSLTELGVAGLFGARPEIANGFSDSGYAYVTAASSAFGLIALWLFVSLVVPAQSLFQRRAGLFVCLYFFLSLLISGTSVFSIKAAALLWLFIGYATAHAHGVKAEATDEGEARAPAGGWRDSGRGFRTPGSAAASPSGFRHR